MKGKTVNTLKRWHLIVVSLLLLSVLLLFYYVFRPNNNTGTEAIMESFFGRVAEVHSKLHGNIIVKLEENPHTVYIRGGDRYFSKFFEYSDVYLKKDQYVDTIFFLKKDTIPGKLVVFFSLRYP